MLNEPDPFSGEDSDGSIVSYLWEQTSGQSVSLAGSDSSRATFDILTVTGTTELAFRLTVTDNSGAMATDEIVITLTP